MSGSNSSDLLAKSDAVASIVAAVLALLVYFDITPHPIRWYEYQLPIVIGILAVLVLLLVLLLGIAIKRGRRLLTWLSVPSLFLTLAALGYASHEYVKDPSNTIVLVADLSGDDRSKYDVTGITRRGLEEALSGYPKIEVVPLGREIDEQDRGAARVVGKRFKAAIVIWGRVIANESRAGLVVHFELLRRPPLLPEIGPEVNGRLLRRPVAQLQDFTIQTRLSNRMTYLSLVVAGLAQYSEGDWQDAITSLSGALKQKAEPVGPIDRALILFYRGTAYGRDSHPEKAIKDFTATLLDEPGHPEVYVNRGIAYSQMGMYDHAIRDFDVAADLNPKDEGIYLNRGLAFYNKGQTTRALRDFNQALTINPRNPDVYLNLGITMGREARYQDAIANFNRAIGLSPERVDLYINRGITYTIMSDYRRALADLNKGIELDPQLAEAYVARARVYGLLGDLNRYFADVNHAIRINPGLSEAYAQRAAAYGMRQNFTDAIRDADHAIKIDPNNASGYYLRASIYAAQGRLDIAIRDYGLAISLQPRDPLAYMARGAARTRLGDRGAAKKDLQRAIELSRDPSMREVAQRLLDNLSKS